MVAEILWREDARGESLGERSLTYATSVVSGQIHIRISGYENGLVNFCESREWAPPDAGKKKAPPDCLSDRACSPPRYSYTNTMLWGQTIHEYEPDGDSAKEFAALADAIAELLNVAPTPIIFCRGNFSLIMMVAKDTNQSPKT